MTEGILLFDRAVVIPELNCYAKQPEKGQQTTDRSPERRFSREFIGKHEANSGESQQHENDIKRVDDKDLPNDGRNFDEIFPVME